MNVNGLQASANLGATEALGSQPNYSQQAAYLGADSGQGTTVMHGNYKSTSEVAKVASLKQGSNLSYGATKLGESITNIQVGGAKSNANAQYY